MEDYNKIIESLGVKFIKARNIRILQPIRIKNFYDVENSLLILYKGEVSFGEEETPVEEGDMLFIPGGKMISVTYGNAEKPKAVNNEDLRNRPLSTLKTYIKVRRNHASARTV